MEVRETCPIMRCWLPRERRANTHRREIWGYPGACAITRQTTLGKTHKTGSFWRNFFLPEGSHIRATCDHSKVVVVLTSRQVVAMEISYHRGAYLDWVLPCHTSIDGGDGIPCEFYAYSRTFLVNSHMMTDTRRDTGGLDDMLLFIRAIGQPGDPLITNILGDACDKPFYISMYTRLLT